MKKDIASKIEEFKGKKTVDPKTVGIPEYAPEKNSGPKVVVEETVDLQYAKFFDKKVDRRSKRLKKSKHNISARKTYWRTKLRKMGVPEIDLDETVSGILSYRMKRRYHDRNPETARKASRKWHSKHRKYHLEYHRRWYANKRLAQRRKLLLAMGG